MNITFTGRLSWVFNMNKILITGTAGFIGFHLAKRLLEEGYEVTGLDCINDYYDVNIKYARLNELGITRDQIVENVLLTSTRYPLHHFIRLKLEEKEKVAALFELGRFDTVIHLAAQAGVRYSIENPWAYIESNIIGHLSILEACRHFPVEHLVFASSSSVYGINEKMPLAVNDNVDHPISLYAATKKSDELMSHVYSSLYGVPVSGLRFFTVYGPWGRPDMALFKFTKAMLQGKPVEIYNYGKMVRDFTYIDDIVEGIIRVAKKPPVPDPDFDRSSPDPSASFCPYRICNIGNSNPVKLEEFIDAIEKELGVKAKREYLPIQPGDVPMTYADVRKLEEEFGYKPSTTVEEGISKFISWWKTFY
jgi:UDP-glucuronate 4-epimerase